MAVELHPELREWQAMNRRVEVPPVNPALFHGAELVELPPGRVKTLVDRLLRLERERNELLAEVRQARALLLEAQRRDDQERARLAAAGKDDQPKSKSYEQREQDRLLKVAGKLRSRVAALAMVAREIMESDDLAVVGRAARQQGDAACAEIEDLTASLRAALERMRRARQLVAFADDPRRGLVVDGPPTEEDQAFAVLTRALEPPAPPQADPTLVAPTSVA
jgi:hypothetical protein